MLCVKATQLPYSPVRVVSEDTADAVEQAQHGRVEDTWRQSSFATHSQLRRMTMLHDTFERRYGAQGQAGRPRKEAQAEEVRR